MKMNVTNKLILALLPLFFIVGCGAKYCHQYKSLRDFEKDKYECSLVAQQVAAQWGMQGNPFVLADEMDKCMRYRYDWYKCQEY